jgi:hypothetical protein
MLRTLACPGLGERKPLDQLPRIVKPTFYGPVRRQLVACSRAQGVIILIALCGAQQQGVIWTDFIFNIGCIVAALPST